MKTHLVSRLTLYGGLASVGMNRLVHFVYSTTVASHFATHCTWMNSQYSCYRTI